MKEVQVSVESLSFLLIQVGTLRIQLVDFDISILDFICLRLFELQIDVV